MGCYKSVTLGDGVTSAGGCNCKILKIVFFWPI